LGNISPFGRYFSLSNFFKLENLHNFFGYFFHGYSYDKNFDEKWVGQRFGDIFT
jgi:hypothetical protein